MAFFNSLNISGSGLTASRFRMDLISQNLANAQTTRTAEGGPYKRKMAVYEPIEGQSFYSLYRKELAGPYKGVKVTDVVEDDTQPTPVYDPDNPDADADGYVQMPNVDIVKETIDMMSASRAYEANLTAFNAMKSMASKSLEIK